MGLSKIPLVTFAVACLMFYGVVSRYRKDRKAFIVTYLSAGIGCLFLTIQRLNKIYFTLPKSIVFLIDIFIFVSFIIMVILIFYCAFTNKDKQPFGKLPPIK